MPTSITPEEKSRAVVLSGMMAFVQAVILRFRGEVIDPLIPSQASAQNQLADKAFVNSSIATATVSDVSYDQSTGKLKKTANGTTTNVCDVVTSGFRIIADDTTGYDTLTAFGSASITPNDSTGYDAFVY